MAEAAFEPVGFLSPKIFGLPVDREVLFSNHKDIYKKRVEKRQRKLIVKISFLKPFLKQGEHVLVITTGYSPLHSLAQYLTGFVFVYLNRSIFVFTNYRIFHIPATANYNYNNSIAQVAYAGCQSVELKGGSLIVRYERAGNKRIEKFSAIAGTERRKIRSLLKKKIPLSGTKGQLSARIHLCPRCTHRLAEGKNKCGKCQLQFKSKLVAALSAILIPGGGYFYIRQYLLGVLDALLEIGLAVLMAYLFIGIHDQMPLESVHLALIPIFLYLKIGAVIHSSHFTKEFIPKDKTVKTCQATV
ncbi:hypothetical protein D1BOALGB6SA_4759 [Olavius sp. associated proteobacterium Delta 1]|nr:hypothetical protein D1BOALGB6SA_4759 [Olavius sp. associated proteobacterium Delta 1]